MKSIEPFLSEALLEQEKKLDDFNGYSNDTQVEQTKRTEESKKWCVKAQKQTESFLPGIDPDLSAQVRRLEVFNNTTGKTSNEFVLLFEHSTHPDVRWSMSIEENDEYLEKSFKNIVEKVYRRKTFKEESASYNRSNYEDFDNGFGNQKFEELEDKEREVSDVELSVISEANQITNSIRGKYGFGGLDVPTRAIHVIKNGEWQGSGTAQYIEELKAILIRETPRSTIFQKKVVHEMLHAKSMNIFPRWLNEALIEEMTVEAIRKSIHANVFLKNELAESNAVMAAYEGWVTREGEPLFGKETFFAYLDQNNIPHSENFTYVAEREKMHQMMQKIYEKQSHDFQSPEAVFEIFIKAAMSGDVEELKKKLGEDIMEMLKTGMEPWEK